MILGGFQRLTLIDYPGKVASTVFTVGCNFRCPFCHNPELVLSSQFADNSGLEKDFFKFLKTRKGKIDAICITGGEPTIQKDLEGFIKKIKKLGFLVKLDTNGMRPDVLKKLFDLKLLDFVAMDVKNQLKRYNKTIGAKNLDKARIKLSADLIKNSGIPYEFRTTVVPGIHQMEDFVEIAKWLQGARSYYLQEYRETKILDPKLKKKTKGKRISLEKIKKKIEKYFGKVGIRQ